MHGFVMSRPPHGRAGLVAPGHEAEQGEVVAGSVPYQDLAPYLGDGWIVPDLHAALGEFAYPTFAVIGNKVYLFGQVQYRGTDSGSEASATVITLPVEARPNTSTAVRLFTNTVDSDGGLWGPGYWDASVSPNGALTLGGAVNMPHGVPATADGTVVTLVLEGIEWTRSTGADIPDEEELLLAPYLNEEWLPAEGEDAPKLIRRRQHVALQGVISSQAVGNNRVIENLVIPEDWRPKDLTRTLILEWLSGPTLGANTHWYGIVGVGGVMSVNSDVAWGATWHYFNDGAAFALREYETVPVGGFYTSELFLSAGAPDPGTLLGTNRDLYTFAATFKLGGLDDNTPSGIFWNLSSDDGYTLEYVDQGLDKYGIRLYVFHGLTRTLLSQRNNIDVGVDANPSSPIQLFVRTWWELVDESDVFGPRRVFIEIETTGTGGLLSFNHRTDASPAAISEKGHTGVIGLPPDRSRGEIILFNNADALGNPDLDTVRLHGGWLANAEVPPEPGDVQAGTNLRGVVPRP